MSLSCLVSAVVVLEPLVGEGTVAAAFDEILKDGNGDVGALSSIAGDGAPSPNADCGRQIPPNAKATASLIQAGMRRSLLFIDFCSVSVLSSSTRGKVALRSTNVAAREIPHGEDRPVMQVALSKLGRTSSAVFAN